MNVLWARGSGTAGDVQVALSAKKKLAYTSISTILRILEQKGVLRAEKEGRGHTYFPLFTKEDYSSLALESLVTRVFDGAPAALARQLIQNEKLTREDIDEIRRLIDSMPGAT